MSKKVCIIGLGLIGGSLGMAIKQRQLAQVIGLTRESSKIPIAVQKGAIDFGTTNPKEAVKGADIVFICYPIHLIIPEIIKILKFVKPGAIITDVGSTKAEIVNKAEKIMPEGVFFIGGHPMAGKEKIGLEVAEASLLRHKNYVLTKTKRTNTGALNNLKDFIELLGANVSILPPDIHDSAAAAISHALIAIAAAAVNSVGSSGKLRKLMCKLASSGFQDFTRIASGEPTLAVDMFYTNKKAVLNSLNRFKVSLRTIERAIRSGKPRTIKKELAKAKKLRDSIYT